jgi:hypothetical protein
VGGPPGLSCSGRNNARFLHGLRFRPLAGIASAGPAGMHEGKASTAISIHTVQSGSRKRPARPTARSDALRERMSSHDSAGIRHGSWQAPLIPGDRSEIRIMSTQTVPIADKSLPRYASCCFPHSSPAFAFGAWTQKTAREGDFKLLISVKKSGAGEGIRTLDPNLGKVVLYP